MEERIIINPMICHGKPVIRGTRTPVFVILGALAGGDSYETLEREYSISADDIRACIAFSAYSSCSTRFANLGTLGKPFCH